MIVEGVYTALITPFYSNGEIDFNGFKSNIKAQLDAGIAGLVVLGTTGETPALKSEERERIIRTAIESVDKKVPIIVGTGTNCTRTTVKETIRAQKLGADCALIVTPYYNKPTSRGVIAHYRSITEEVNLPFIQYNVRSRTGINVSAETMAAISELPGALGVKEASGDIDQASEIVRDAAQANRNFALLSGDDAMTLPMMAIGGRGVVSVASNLLPGSVVSMVTAALEGNYSRARLLHQQLLSLFKETFIETNPVPIKYCMDRTGLAAGGVRLPLIELKDQSKERLDKLLGELAELT